ncbi:MAG: hypothetical protein QOG43_188 [Actinomycetota bacterium]|jgi:hypothetical protein|nr:hypothetical protein [Actinomycetota bacterium]
MEHTAATLDALRLEGDPPADHVVRHLFESGQLAEVNRALRSFDDNDQSVPDDLPPPLRHYLTETAHLPTWTDRARLAGAYRFFVDDGLQVAVSLSIGAMVGSYAVPSGAKVLSATHRLHHPPRRMAETFQFVLYMMDDDPFGPKGNLIRAIQKVRLMHASVRRLMVDSGTWEFDTYGWPINQEDMLCAILLFSTVTLDGMARMGVVAEPEEAENYYHLWRVIGAMLGVRPDVMPETVDEARALWEQVLRPRVWGPTPEGVELTRCLMERHQDGMPSALQGIVPAVIRQIVGPEVAAWMEVPRSRWSRVVRLATGLASLLERAEDESRVAERALDRLGQHMLEGQARKLCGVEQEFDIPAILRHDAPTD